jgi:hypothetical protein
LATEGKRDERLLTNGSIPSLLVPFVFIEVVEHARDIGLEVLYGRTLLRREVLEFNSHIFWFVDGRRKLEERGGERKEKTEMKRRGDEDGR